MGLNNPDRQQALETFMNVYWLRPENALWFAWDASVVAPCLRDLKAPSMDLGCGDGTTSFMFLGGRFGIDFDAYESVVDEGSTYARPAVDYYDRFDQQLKQLPVPVEARPTATYSLGLDWKQSLLDKASRLGLHERLVQHDVTQPLPVGDESFNTIFSNIIYWLPNAGEVLCDLRRVTAPGGLFIMTCPDAGIRQVMFAQYQQRYGLDWIADLDRGRSLSYKHAYTTGEWKDLFQKAGWRVNDHVMYVPQLVMLINEVGFRPMFPTFMKVYQMAQQQGPEAFRDLKRQWMDNALHFLRPFCDEDWMDRLSMPRVWHRFVLEPA